MSRHSGGVKKRRINSPAEDRAAFVRDNATTVVAELEAKIERLRARIRRLEKQAAMTRQVTIDVFALCRQAIRSLDAGDVETAKAVLAFTNRVVARVDINPSSS